jgi:hypothetical protein
MDACEACSAAWNLATNLTFALHSQCTLYRRATRHVLTRGVKSIDVDGGIFENVLY